jgi:hypothetical protein
MSDSEKLCEACGKAYKLTPGPGRPPKFCPKCRKPRGIDGNRAATVARSNAKAQNAVAAAERSAVSTTIEQAMRMAFALEAHADPVRAAAFAGLTLDPVQAKALAKAAREIYPDGVSNIVLSGLGRAVLGGMLLHLASNTAHLKPDFTAGGAKALGQLMTALSSSEDAPTTGDFVFNLTGASGQTVSVVRDPATVVRPKLPT